MPIGGERIGSAYVRIFGDGSGLPGDIKDALERSEPTVRAMGRDLGAAYEEEYSETFLSRQKRRDLGVELRESLERNIARADTTDAYFGSENWRGFLKAVDKEYGAAGRLAAKRLEEEFSRRGVFNGGDLLRQLETFQFQVQRAEEEIAKSEQQERDRELDARIEFLNDIAEAQDAAVAEDARRTEAILAKQREDRDREFKAETQRLAELASLQSEAAAEDVRRTREAIAKQQEDRDKEYDLELQRQRDYADLFDQAAKRDEEINIARFRAYREYTQRTKAQAESLAAALGRLGTASERSSDSQRDIIQRLRELQANLSSVPAGDDRDDLAVRINDLRRAATNATPASDRFSRSLLRLGDAIGASTGRGSRNNFVNIVGSLTRGLTNLVTLGPRIAFQVGSKMVNAFQDAGGGAAGFGKAALQLGSSLAVGTVALGLFGAAAFGLVLILGPIAALISGITAAVVGLAATITFGAISSIIALAGVVGILATGLGVGVLAITGMSEKMKKELQPAVNALKESFSDLGRSAGDAIGPGLLDALRELAPGLQRLKPLTDSVAEALGDLARQYAEGFNSDGFSRFIEQIGPFTANQIRDLGSAFQNFAEGLGGFFVASKPLIRDFVDGLEDIGLSFSEYANSKSGRDEIRNFLERASDSAKSLGGFIASATEAIGELFFAGSGAGDTIFDDLSNAFERYADYLRDPANKSAISDFFANGVEIARDLGNAVEFLFGLINDLDTEKSRQELQELFDAIGDIGNAVRDLVPVFQALGATAGFIVDLAKGIYDVAEAIVTFPADALNFIGDGLDAIFNPGSAQKNTENSLRDLAVAAAGTKEPLATSKAAVDDLAASLDNVTGATTEATEAMLIQKVVELDNATLLRSLNLTQKDVVNALLGRVGAQKKVNDAVNNGSELNKKQGQSLLDFIGIQRRTVKEGQAQVRQNSLLRQSFENLRGVITDDLRLKLESEGIIPTKKGLADVVLQYDELDTRKNIKKLIEATGVDATVADIKKVIDKLEETDEQKPTPVVSLDDAPARKKFTDLDRLIADFNRETATASADLSTDGFFGAAGNIRTEVSNLNNLTATIDIIANRIGNFGPFGADGGTVGKGTLNQEMFMGLANGGTIQGAKYPYGDRDLYRLAPGEEVVANDAGQADRYRGLLKAINSGADISKYLGNGRTVDASGWVIQTTTGLEWSVHVRRHGDHQL